MIDDKVLWAIRVLALEAAENPTDLQIMAKLDRWFSREFHVPLPEVEKLPDEYILKHFFEDRAVTLFKGNDEQYKDYLEERNELLFPDQVKKSEDSDDAWVDELEQEVAAQGVDISELKQTDGLDSALLNLIDKEYKLPDSGSFGE